MSSIQSKTLFFRLILLLGCGIFFYPTISDYVNNITQSRAIVQYQQALSDYDGMDVADIKARADAYNQALASLAYPLTDYKDITGYELCLDPFQTGMMGSIAIDKIGVNLPVYHKVNEGVIQVGVGHLQGSSLPIGGPSTHAVLSTHSGLPSAKLFTDLHKLELGDEFRLSILGEELLYRVDQILTVLPQEVDALAIQKGQDYVTLFTCTPYGINTHRLLIRGHREEIPQVVDGKKTEEKAREHLWLNGAKIGAIALIFAVIIGSIVKEIRMICFSKKQ